MSTLRAKAIPGLLHPMGKVYLGSMEYACRCSHCQHVHYRYYPAGRKDWILNGLKATCPCCEWLNHFKIGEGEWIPPQPAPVVVRKRKSRT